MIRAGIDVGISGAIAILNDKEAAVYDMPVMAGTGKRQQVNAATLSKLLADKNIEVAYVERVSAMPGQGVSSSFGFGMSYGIVIGVLATLEIPMVLVTPQSWKGKAGLLGKPKDYSRTLAQQLFPQVDLSKKKHHGRAEALLIAQFANERLLK